MSNVSHFYAEIKVLEKQIESIEEKVRQVRMKCEHKNVDMVEISTKSNWFDRSGSKYKEFICKDCEQYWEEHEEN